MDNLSAAAMRGHLMTLAFIHPMFAWLAVGAIMASGLDRPLPSQTPASNPD